MIFDISVEILAATILGVFLGNMLDRATNSAPVFLIICLILSFVAVFKVLWRKYIK